MAASQTFNITQSSLVTTSGTTTLQLLITPQPTNVGGTSVTSPYVMQFTIASPTNSQLTAYQITSGNPNPTITLTTNV